ncbi:MAG TPA: ABC transporter substrate-binding protein [Candidatus Binatia bacterium]|jgi:putative ABC transport system substrate-binding protein
MIGVLACALLLALCSSAEAQQKLPRIGFLFGFSPAVNADRIDAFRRGMRELGYSEGKNILIEYRYAEGDRERLRELATELVRLRVDLIVSGGPAVTRPAKEATRTIPIVMAQDTDPVGNGFVASLARPGGNITGLSALAPEISGKRLELLKEIVPKLGRVVIFGTASFPGSREMLKETELAAAALGLQIQPAEVRSPSEVEAAFRKSSRARPDAGLVLAGAVIFSERKKIADLSLRSRLPMIFPQSEYVEDGGLMSYAPSYPDLFRRAATYVDKILKGAKPADLPVEQPTKFEMIINLKTAKQIGLAIPPIVLARADRVIR